MCRSPSKPKHGRRHWARPSKAPAMGQLRIQRAHQLGWDGARQLAHTWATEAEARWRLPCETTRLDDHDRMTFRGPGVQGEMQVWPDRFELQLQLGFLLSAYQSRIEAEIQRQLDLQLGPTPADR